MPPPRKNGDIPNKARNVLSKAKRRGEAVEFDEGVFAQWVTGAHKRRVERQRVGHKEAADEIKLEKSQERQEQNRRVRELVKQHFGEVAVERDGRLVFSGTGQDDAYSDSDEEFEEQQRAAQAKREKKLNLLAQEAKLKNLPKWAQAKQAKQIELQKDDSIVKEQNESFIKAQFSFNKDNSVAQIADDAGKNKLLKNLKMDHLTQKKEEQRANMMPAVMNFENDNSIVVVETSNLDQVNLSSAIISRRAQRELAQQAQRDVIDTSRMGRRNAAIQSNQIHTIDSSDDDEELIPKKKVIKLVKKSTATTQNKQQTSKQSTKKTTTAESDSDNELSEMQKLQARFSNRSIKKPENIGKRKQQALNRKQKAANKKLIRRYNNDSTESEDERDYDTTSEEEEEYEEVVVEETDEDDVVEEEDEEEEEETVQKGKNFTYNAPQRRPANFRDEPESDDDDKEEEIVDDDYFVEEGDELGFDDDNEWSAAGETILEDDSDSDAMDDKDVITAKLGKAQMKKFEKEQAEKQRKSDQEAKRQEELQRQKALKEQQQMELLEKKKKEQEIKQPTKRQKTNQQVEAELSRDKQLAASISADLINNEFSIEQAVSIPMHSASAWFMLPKPKVWDQEDERKKRLIALRQREAAVQDGTWDFEAERERKRKLTPVEAMEYDPTYGWEEGDSSNRKDMSEILGIPAACMGGRNRKKPLSEKNKKNSSDSRKAKKAEKQRQKDLHTQMAFEAGFADTNTTGRSITWNDSSDDDRKEYRGGAKFKEPKNRKERMKFEFKKKSREENAHKRGKMVTGKYYFGEKDSAVNF